MVLNPGSWALLLATICFRYFVAGGSSTRAGLPFVRNGTIPSGLFPGWHVNYYAVNFLPVCGTYSTVKPAHYTNSVECEPAMEHFRTTAAKVTLYNTAGLETTQGFGSGETFCMCYGVYEKDGTFLDHCYLVGSEGEIRIRNGYAAGVQDVESNREKMIPECKDVSIAENGTVTVTTSRSSDKTSPAGSGHSETSSSDSKDK